MDQDGFQIVLGEFPITLASKPVEALFDLWNGEMTKVVGMITLKCPHPWSAASLAP